MHIAIEIPNKDIPKNQDIIDIPLHFIDGKVCEAGGYGFMELHKGHGDLIDRKELLKQPMDKANYPSNYVKIAPIIIEADNEIEE